MTDIPVYTVDSEEETGSVPAAVALDPTPTDVLDSPASPENQPITDEPTVFAVDDEQPEGNTTTSQDPEVSEEKPATVQDDSNSNGPAVVPTPTGEDSESKTEEGEVTSEATTENEDPVNPLEVELKEQEESKTTNNENTDPATAPTVTPEVLKMDVVDPEDKKRDASKLTITATEGDVPVTLVVDSPTKRARLS